MPDNIMRIGDSSTMVAFADAPGNYCSILPSAAAGGYNPVARHNKGVNVCFLDGHAVLLAGDYLGVGKGIAEHADVRWRPPNSTWTGDQD
jgi:prepilin-type processing-associated H-X9-DG protein